MKKVFLSLAAALMMLTSCGTSGLGSLGQLGQVLGNGETMGNVLQSVLGLDKMTAANLVGTWTYKGPGCAFTSKELLAQAGGEVVAADIKQRVKPTFDNLGITSSNTRVTFKEDGTFSASIAGKQFSGNYTFDAQNYKVTMKGLLLTINCYAKRNADGIGLLFESSKLLTLLQTMSALSGNTTLQTVGDLSKAYDGVRLGFDFRK